MFVLPCFYLLTKSKKRGIKLYNINKEIGRAGGWGTEERREAWRDGGLKGREAWPSLGFQKGGDFIFSP